MVEMSDKFVDAKKLFQNMFETAKELKNIPGVKVKKKSGKVLWNSREKGTYIRRKHGELK